MEETVVQALGPDPSMRPQVPAVHEKESGISIPMTKMASASGSASVIDSTDMTVRLLGGFSVSVGDHVVDDPAWDLRKAKSLVKLLALNHRHELHREQVIELLWPDLDPQAGSNNLHKVLHVARRVLQPCLEPKAPSAYLHSRGELIALSPPGALQIDAERFREAAQTARAGDDPEQYAHALGLYSGDLLPGDRYEDWAAGTREKLRTLRLELLIRLAELRELSADTTGAIEVLRELVMLDPAHEVANERLMNLLVRCGHRHLALRQYHFLREALREELDAEPGLSAQALHQQILNGDIVPQVEAPTKPADPVVTWTPQSGSIPPLVGREAELGQLSNVLEGLLAGEGKLVLLRGEAGIGKTRLAAEFTGRASNAGVLTLWGSAGADDKHVPYRPFVEALEGLALQVAPGNLVPLLERSESPLATLVAAVSPDAKGPIDSPSAAGQEAWRLFASLTNCLTELASKRPVLVVLDNLHCADDASLYLLDYLVTTLRGTSVCFLATLCPEEGSDRSTAARITAKLEGEQRAQCLEVGPLTRTDTDVLVARLLDGAIDPGLVDVVYKAAFGNPYYTEEAVRALEGRRALRRDQNQWSLKDRDVASLGRDRLRRRNQAGQIGLAS